MPAFPQYLLESLLCLALFAGYYGRVLKATGTFGAKRFFLRAMLPIAYGLPLLVALSPGNGRPSAPSGSLEMSVERLLAFEFPEFALSLATAFLAVFFVGFALRAFRLVDTLWEAGSFLKSTYPPARPLAGWQANPTARLGLLLFSWDNQNDAGKQAWADKWLPMSRFFVWEFLLVEIFCALNWWNPLAYWYRRQWSELYGTETERPAPPPAGQQQRLAGALVPLSLAICYFFVIPQSYSPTAAAGHWAGQHLRVVVYEHKKNNPLGYAFQWGELSIVLKKYANPNGYEGSVEMELSTFREMLREEIKVFRGRHQLRPGTISVLYRSGTGNEQAYINDIDPRFVILKDRRSGKVYNDLVSYGDEVVVFGDTEDIYLSRIRIHILDPRAGYEPVVNVPDIDHHVADFSFQIVGRAGKRTLVKVDSQHPNAWRILELYQDSERYEIVHIPGFRTNRRYVTENEALLSKISAAGFDLAAGLPDVNYLPEYQGYLNLPVHLLWGTLEAAPSSENYTVAQFADASGGELFLQVGEMRFVPEAFEIVIAGKGGVPFGFRADGLHYFSLRQAFSQIRPETSIYFDRIVIRDSDGALKLFPAAFAFHVGADKATD